MDEKDLSFEKRMLYNQKMKDTELAIWLSFLPGVGHLYIGKKALGIMFLLTIPLWAFVIPWIILVVMAIISVNKECKNYNINLLVELYKEDREGDRKCSNYKINP